MAIVAPLAYPNGMTTDRQRQRIVDAVTMAMLGGVTEAEILQLVQAGLDVASRIASSRVPIDWDNLPTIGSLAA